MSGEGIGLLAQEALKVAIGEIKEVVLSLPSSASKAVVFIENRSEVIHRDWKEDRSIFTVQIGRNQIEQVLSIESDLLIDNSPAAEAIESLWSKPV